MPSSSTGDYYYRKNVQEEEKKEIDFMPVAINSNRPPAGNNSNGAPRTTTSRRGGRTRSRSPPVVNGRGEALTPSGIGGGPDNPSSAAAAAAAAAKTFSTNGGVAAARSSWPADEERQYSGSRQQQWDQDYGMRRYPAGSYPYRGEASAEYSDRRSYQPQRYDTADRNRYRSSRYPQEGAYRYERKPSRQQSSPPPPPRGSTTNGGTTLVLGGPTPIHLPKKPVNSYDRGGSAASVFRGRPDAPASNNNSDDDSPQKILLSLRTPTTSFEDKGVDKSKRGLSLSPTDPPQIQNSNRQSSDALFEPQKDPLDVAKSGSIDMAPSFNLFNQSFDSFGDTNYFHVGSTLQNDSFGMGRTNSVEANDTGAAAAAAPNAGSTQLLHKTSSVGNASQLLASGSGALTIGYSPVNSFGNTSVASRRGDMVVGGNDTRSASPSQVLNIYRSYSGGRPDMLEDSHMRMSVGSFGAGPTYSYGRNSFGGEAYYNSSRSGGGNEDRGPHFYVLLRKFRSAFKECTFLLPGLKAALLEAPETDGGDGDEQAAIKQMHSAPPSRYPDPTPQDTLIARRRVESSICAFGGSLSRERALHAKEKTGDNKESIFRGKEETEEQKSVTVTPSSSISSPPATHVQSQSRLKYEEALQGRYYENESRLSWEFEENPPVDVSTEVPQKDVKDGANEGGADEDGSTDSKDQSSDIVLCEAVNEDQEVSSKSGSSASPQPKMRYRCKLCGQPKQNHRCPYQQSLARSIGIMVYPAVNAFTAAEPGSIATPLSDMNNFVDTMKDSASLADEAPGLPTPDRVRRLGTGAVSTSTQVTPESMRSSKLQGSPFATPARSNRHRSIGNSKKRSYAQLAGSSDDNDLLFVESMELKHEQFRSINDSKTADGHEPYSYPTLPLPYAQRKKLSDNLFSLSNEIPKLTDECAQVLREAREKDLWDLAVSELMTQVIVILHCPEGDSRFDGLRTYLLTLGIAC